MLPLQVEALNSALCALPDEIADVVDGWERAKLAVSHEIAEYKQESKEQLQELHASMFETSTAVLHIQQNMVSSMRSQFQKDESIRKTVHVHASIQTDRSITKEKQHIPDTKTVGNNIDRVTMRLQPVYLTDHVNRYGAEDDENNAGHACQVTLSEHSASNGRILQELQTSLANVTAELLKIQKERDALKSAVKQLSLHNIKNDLSDSITRAETETSSATYMENSIQEKAALTQSVMDLQKTIQEQEQLLGIFNSRIAHSKTEYDTCRAKCVQVEEELTALHAQKLALHLHLEADSSRINTLVRALHYEQDRNEPEVEQNVPCTEDSQLLAEDIENQQDALKSMQANFDALTEAVDQMKQFREQISSEIAEKQQVRDNAESALSSLHESLRQAQSQFSNTQRLVDSENETLEKYRAESLTLQTEISEHKEELGTIQSNVATENEALRILFKQRKEITHQLDSLRESRDQSQEISDDLLSKVEERQNLLQETKNTMMAYEERTANLKADEDDLRTKVEKLRAESEEIEVMSQA